MSRAVSPDQGHSRVFLDDIIVLPSRRAINESSVAEIAASMKDIGLQYPITVRFVASADEYSGSDTVLVAGRHRLEGARKLGWRTIDCIYQAWDDRQARMWEIAENLPMQEALGNCHSGPIFRYDLPGSAHFSQMGERELAR
jgi:ParB-like chromosome segregation protein Spo0J